MPRELKYRIDELFDNRDDRSIPHPLYDVPDEFLALLDQLLADVLPKRESEMLAKNNIKTFGDWFQSRRSTIVESLSGPRDRRKLSKRTVNSYIKIANIMDSSFMARLNDYEFIYSIKKKKK